MERISRLLYKHLRGTLSEAEEAELMAWAAADPANRALLERVGDGERFDADLRAWYALPRKSVADDPRLDAEITAHERRSKVRRLRPWLPYAAAAAILLAVGWLLLVDSRESSVDGLAATEILPGGNRATLTLADGRVINLDEAQTGIIVGAEDITYDDGSAVSPANGPHAGLTTYDLQLTTPKGGTYQITLPDGSKVWLNSASTLKYPSRFSGDSREVILEGEAYFDIQPQVGGVGANPEGLIGDNNHSPFSVRTANQVVNVLGTEFNISAYPDDPETKTTLVTGKVRVDVGANPEGLIEDNKHSPHKGVTLTPGQQATTRAHLPGQGAATTINTVDIDQHTAWKSGKFSFEGKSFAQVMRELARWYDLEVVYEGDIPQETFFGDAYRNTNLSVVLGALQSAEIDYRIEQGRKLIITGKRGGKP